MSTELLTNSETDFDGIVPFLVIKLLPYENRPEYGMARIVPGIQGYLSRGVDYVWIVDAREKVAMCFSRTDPTGEICDVLRTGNPLSEVPLEFDLDA